MKLMLAEPFKSLWAGRDPFAEVEGLQGEVYRELEARRTLRTEVDGNGFFVKIHRGIGWGEIFKNLFTAKLSVLGAGQEWRAIQRLSGPLRSKPLRPQLRSACTRLSVWPNSPNRPSVSQPMAPTSACRARS